MQGKRNIATKKDILCKSHEWQTDESLNIYCSNSNVYILVKNSISVGLFVFVYEFVYE